MSIARFPTRAIALALSVVLIVTTLTLPHAQAGLIPTERLVATQALSDDRSRIADAIMRSDVRHQMEALGIDPLEAKARINALTDEEVRRVAGQLDRLPAGQGAFETAIIASLFAFVILLVTDILGYTNVFPFVKKTVQPQ